MWPSLWDLAAEARREADMVTAQVPARPQCPTAPLTWSEIFHPPGSNADISSLDLDHVCKPESSSSFPLNDHFFHQRKAIKGIKHLWREEKGSRVHCSAVESAWNPRIFPQVSQGPSFPGDGVGIMIFSLRKNFID